MGVDPEAHVAAPPTLPLWGAPLRGQRELYHHPVWLLAILWHVVTQVIYFYVAVAAFQHDSSWLRQSTGAGKL